MGGRHIEYGLFDRQFTTLGGLLSLERIQAGANLTEGTGREYRRQRLDPFRAAEMSVAMQGITHQLCRGRAR